MRMEVRLPADVELCELRDGLGAIVDGNAKVFRYDPARVMSESKSKSARERVRPAIVVGSAKVFRYVPSRARTYTHTYTNMHARARAHTHTHM